jgi:hypothetical protein
LVAIQGGEGLREGIGNELVIGVKWLQLVPATVVRE